MGGSSSGSDRALDVNKEILDNYKRLRSLVEPTGTVLQQQANLSKVQDLQHIEPAIARIVSILPPDQHAVLNALIENWRNIIRSIEKANEVHVRAAVIRVPGIVTGILGWLCIFGLVLPLGYLSAYEPNSKITLLSAFAIGVLSIPAYIGFELARIYRLRRVDISRV